MPCHRHTPSPFGLFPGHGGPYRAYPWSYHVSDPVSLAAAIALLVSINFGVANHVQHIALDHMDVRSGTMVNIATTALIFWLLSPFYLVPSTLLTSSAAYFALAGESASLESDV